MYSQLKKSKTILFLTSPKITTVLLLLLGNIVFWGTLDQADRGLWASQQKYFYSWLYRAPLPYTNGLLWFPLPGMLLIGWLMTLQQILCFIFRFKYIWAKSGILIMHFGLLCLLLGGGISFYFSKESQVTLSEGQSTEFAMGYHTWELSIWKNSSYPRSITALNLEDFSKKSQVKIPQLQISIEIEENMLNALAYAEQPGLSMGNLINSSHIALLKEVPHEKEPEQNVPGLIFKVLEKNQRILLYGAEQAPTPLIMGQDTLFFQVRREHIPLPFTITLNKFERKLHGGTQMASAFMSTIQVKNKNFEQEAIVQMNEPYRFEDWTFFQASFNQNQMSGVQQSTFASVKNAMRLAPYISSLIMSLGLSLHFLLIFMAYLKRRNINFTQKES